VVPADLAVRGGGLSRRVVEGVALLERRPRCCSCLLGLRVLRLRLRLALRVRLRDRPSWLPSAVE
jgi:hypothetical protein